MNTTKPTQRDLDAAADVIRTAAEYRISVEGFEMCFAWSVGNVREAALVLLKNGNPNNVVEGFAGGSTCILRVQDGEYTILLAMGEHIKSHVEMVEAWNERNGVMAIAREMDAAVSKGAGITRARR